MNILYQRTWSHIKSSTRHVLENIASVGVISQFNLKTVHQVRGTENGRPAGLWRRLFLGCSHLHWSWWQFSIDRCPPQVRMRNREATWEMLLLKMDSGWSGQERSVRLQWAKKTIAEKKEEEGSVHRGTKDLEMALHLLSRALIHSGFWLTWFKGLSGLWLLRGQE